jgi:uncharacterized protein
MSVGSKVSNIKTLIRTMEPTLHQGSFVYFSSNDAHQFHSCIFTFKESEGTTFVISEEEAKELKIPFNSVWAWITLEVNSDLEAVGFTAFFSKILGDNEISCNVVAGFYHDHIFVPFLQKEKALLLLSQASVLA